MCCWTHRKIESKLTLCMMKRLPYYLATLILLISETFASGATTSLPSSGRISSKFFIENKQNKVEANLTDLGDSLNRKIRVIVLKEATCFGLKDGVATVETFGMGEKLTYQWDNQAPQFTPTIANLSPGTHIVRVTDELGNVAVDSVVVKFKYRIKVSIDVISDAFNEEISNGIAEVILPTRSAGSYTYVWDTQPKQYARVAQGLAPGMHTVRIKDTRGCEAMEAVSIISSDPSKQRNDILTLPEFHDIEQMDERSEKFQSDLSVYPNPTSGKFYIKWNNREDPLIRLVILNHSGRQILNKRIHNSYSMDYDLSKEQPGVYCVVGYTQSGSRVNQSMLVK